MVKKHGSFEFVFYQSGVLVEIKGKKQSRRSHFLVQNAFQVIDSSAVAELRKQTDLADRTGIIQFLLCYVAIFKSTTTRIIFVKLFGHLLRVHLNGLFPIVSPMEKEFSIEAPTQTSNHLRLLPRVPSCRSYLFVAYITFLLSQLFYQCRVDATLNENLTLCWPWIGRSTQLPRSGA